MKKKMTSKQALEKLNFQCIMSNDIDDKCFEELKIIEKDLEILEILKRKSVDIHLIKDIMKDDRKFECYPDENLTQEEFNIIKDWLENDKRRITKIN